MADDGDTLRVQLAHLILTRAWIDENNGKPELGNPMEIADAVLAYLADRPNLS